MNCLHLRTASIRRGDQLAWLTAALRAMAARSRLVFLYRTEQGVPRDADPRERRNLQDQLARIAAEERDESCSPPAAIARIEDAFPSN